MNMLVSPPDLEQPEGTRETVLIIDDDPAMRLLLRQALTQSGYQIFCEQTGTEGVEKARLELPDMVLLDVMLPDGSGLDFCREIKGLSSHSPISVILMSSMAVSSTEQALGLDAGADGYMPKPLAINELVARMEALFRIRRTEAALLESERLLAMTQRLAGVGGWEWDVRRQTLAWTEETYRIHGFSTGVRLTASELSEKSLRCFHLSDRDDLRQAFARCLERSETFDLELPFTSADGRHLWVRVTGEALQENAVVRRVVGSIMDITRLRENQDQIEKIAKDYERVFHGTQEAMFLVEVLDNAGFRFIRNNLAHQRQTGISLEVFRGKTPHELVGREIGEELVRKYRRCTEAGTSISYEECLTLPIGNRVWHTTLTPVFEEGRIVCIVGSAQDITQRKKAEEKLRVLATTDELTSLWNRRYLMNALHQEMERARRYGQPLSLLLLDIDHFKRINDEYGHDMGDQALRCFATTLKQHLRKVDIPGRLGGEEFAVLLPETGQTGAWTLAERIRIGVAETPIFAGNASIRMTTCIGLAVMHPEDACPEALLKRADDALYQAKNQGRNQTIIAPSPQAGACPMPVGN